MDENRPNSNVQVAVPQMSKHDFLRSIAETLGSYQWPKGSIECINPDNAKLIYLWGNRFKGSAEGIWTAKVNGSPKITINNKEVNIQDGTPYGGALPNVQFDLLVINDNQATPYWAKEFIKIGFEGNDLQPYSIIETNGNVTEGDNSGNPLSAWMKNGNEITDNFLLTLATDLSENTAMAYLALNIVPPEVIQQSMNIFNDMKFNSRDVAVSSRNSVTEDPVPVLIPFYVLEFKFEGKQYHLAMMANDRNIIKGQIPPARKESKSPQEIVEEEMPDKIKQAKMIKWGWLIAIVLLFAVNLTVTFIFLIIWAIGYWLIKKPINDRIKELEQEKTDNMHETATLLKKQLTR